MTTHTGVASPRRTRACHPLAVHALRISASAPPPYRARRAPGFHPTNVVRFSFVWVLCRVSGDVQRQLRPVIPPLMMYLVVESLLDDRIPGILRIARADRVLGSDAHNLLVLL